MPVGPSPAAAAGTSLVVDDDGAQCANATYTDIPDAVADASPGDTVFVCPGEYTSATIDKRLIVRGSTPDLSQPAKCQDDAANPADDNTEDSIVDGGLIVGSSNVTITGFTLTDGAQGVLVPGSVRVVGVTRNVIQGNTIGVNLNGSSVSADHNCIRDNNLAGSASGQGVYSDQGLAFSTISDNAFVGHDGAGITLVGDAAGSLEFVRIERNTSSGDGDLISLIGAQQLTIANNTSTGALGSAIYIQDGNSDLTVSKNTLQNGEDEGIAIDAGSSGFALGANTGLTLTQNTITGNATAGIAVRDDSLTDSTLEKNKVTTNGEDGLRVQPGNTGNTFTKNTLKLNQTVDLSAHDCYDATTGGTGTAGTDNIWSKDKGKTENVTGLCKGAKVTI